MTTRSSFNPKVYLASGNAHKAQEIEAMLGGPVRVLTLKDIGFSEKIVEDGLTFEENARIKVIHLLHFLRSREGAAPDLDSVALADDSGLEVDFLKGEPGVISARYAGEPSDDQANTEKLLKNLAGVPGPKRTAQFRCVLAAASLRQLCDLQPTIHLFQGVCRGKIGFQPKGGHGFGYDPVFFPEGFCRTFAEIDAEEKNEISHRAQAMNQFKVWFDQELSIRSPDRSG
jgi:XTP/dITP diphosphohydrolase